MKYEVYILPFSIVVVVYFWTSSFVVRTSKIHIVLVPRDKWIEKKVSCPESMVLNSGYRPVSKLTTREQGQSLSTQSYSGLCSPGRSYSTYLWNDPWVQTFHKGNMLWSFIKFSGPLKLMYGDQSLEYYYDMDTGAWRVNLKQSVIQPYLPWVEWELLKLLAVNIFLYFFIMVIRTVTVLPCFVCVLINWSREKNLKYKPKYILQTR